MHGIAITRDGATVYATTSENLLSGAKTSSQNLLWEAKISADGSITWGRSIALPGSNLCLSGIALAGDNQSALVCLSRNNSLAIIDLASGKPVREIPVGVAPYAVALSSDGSTAYITNWGGRRPEKGERSSKSSETDTAVDARGIACGGTLSVVDLKAGREITQIEVGLHPSDVKLSADGRTIFVANANSDTVSVIDTGKRRVLETISVRPDPGLPFGSAPNALALGGDGKTLYVADGGNNAVAVVALGAGKHGRSIVRGFIPTAWYPGGLATDGKNLYIANIKGLGSRFHNPKDKAWQINALLGTVTKVEIPIDAMLKKYTAQVRADSRVPQILLALEKAATGEKPVPMPEKIGEASVFEHVVYIIKENKTYDQVFGDIGKGNSEPSLCVFGREISPNQHALAEDFVLLDNYYCNGVCSADGHGWVTQGDTSDYMEKAWAGFPRSYEFGTDCLTYCSSDMIWDDVLGHGLSFRNYGEMIMTATSPAASWSDVYQDYLNKTHKVKFIHSMGNDNLRRYSCPDYPGWNLNIPDVLRAEIFLKEFRDAEMKGDWPNFVTIYLPVDHTTGGRARISITKGSGGRQRPGPRANRGGDLQKQVLAEDVYLCRGGRYADRI